MNQALIHVLIVPTTKKPVTKIYSLLLKAREIKILNFAVSWQEIIYSRIKIQYYRIALACKKVRRRRGKSVAEKIFCSVMSSSADLIL